MGDYDDMTSRLAKALTRHAPHGYDPASDDMTVEFAVKLSDQDAEIDSLRAELVSVRLTLDQVAVEGAADRAELAECQRRERVTVTGRAVLECDRLRAAARQDVDTIEALRRTLDSVRSDRDASDAEIRRLKARSAEEMARLTGAIGRAVLAVTVSGLTVEGYKNACAQARDLLSAALACRPQGERSET